jgi:hypothetical protein
MGAMTSGATLVSVVFNHENLRAYLPLVNRRRCLRGRREVLEISRAARFSHPSSPVLVPPFGAMSTRAYARRRRESSRRCVARPSTPSSPPCPPLPPSARNWQDMPAFNASDFVFVASGRRSFRRLGPPLR